MYVLLDSLIYTAIEPSTIHQSGPTKPPQRESPLAWRQLFYKITCTLKRDPKRFPLAIEYQTSPLWHKRQDLYTINPSQDHPCTSIWTYLVQEFIHLPKEDCAGALDQETCFHIL